jgi:hypothetical protein
VGLGKVALVMQPLGCGKESHEKAWREANKFRVLLLAKHLSKMALFHVVQQELSKHFWCDKYLGWHCSDKYAPW